MTKVRPIPLRVLGACGGAPALQVDFDHHENVTPESVEELLEELKDE